MSVFRITSVLVAWLVIGTPVDVVGAHAAVRTTCQCRDGIWQWVTEAVAEDGSIRESVTDFSNASQNREPFAGMRFGLLEPARTGGDAASEGVDEESERTFPERTRTQIALKDGRLVDLFGKPIRIAADGAVADSDLYAAARLRIEGPASHVGDMRVAPREAGPAQGGAVRSLDNRGSQPSAAPAIRSGTRARSGLGFPDSLFGSRIAQANGPSPATAPARAKPDSDRGSSPDSKFDSPGDWSVLPGGSGGSAPTIVGGVPGAGAFGVPRSLGGGLSGGGAGSPLNFGTPGSSGGGGGSFGGGGGGGFTPVDPPVVCIPEIPLPEIPPIVPEIPDDPTCPYPEEPPTGPPGYTPVVPEPGSMLLLALGGGLGGASWYRRRRSLTRPKV